MTNFNILTDFPNEDFNVIQTFVTRQRILWFVASHLERLFCNVRFYCNKSIADIG